ncbi:kynurenine 3-monooxygenase isoform X2 [Harpegnathos saltator]|uniref:kynurenine 3-monooxygenase isoform X2 n=1 Tax=Harpegnathos saltator TaxID=610380 RepID=UPI00058D6A18|nr:kynurenine 3-monooxygenase isoform X2 [Harpegnathos saltator]
MAEVEKKASVAIVGGGLVGALAACFFAKRGHRVAVYEYRSDIRIDVMQGQSINLALSLRGRETLRAVGLEDALVKNHGMIMRGRMVHNKDGSLKELLYDNVKGNSIYSVNRRHLNIILLNAAEKYPMVQLNFNKKLVDADLMKGTMKFVSTETGLTEDAEADLIIGADGAYSTVRRIMARRQYFNYAQTYIKHKYVELTVPAGDNKETDLLRKFQMSGRNLHIWPRGEFMMTALPNEDRSFTGNLFAPFDIFDKLKTPEAVLSFYAEQFPDLLRLMGEPKLLKDFFLSEPKPLISIQCEPFHVGKTALLVGDAAHAMVPFYAQGMNTGFEDILVLDELMDRYDSDLAEVLPKFSQLRCDDAHAICDLAMYNYIEMRDLLTTKSYLFRKFIDRILYTFFPKFWIPLYISVQFTRMGFRDCMINKEWQDKVLRMTLWFLEFLSVFVILTVSFFFFD